MQHVARLYIFEIHNVAIVDTLAFISILVSGLDREVHALVALGAQADYVARAVKLSALFAPLQEGATVIVEQLNLVAVRYDFSHTALK